MDNMKIFRANRGEGKTKWLVDRAIEAHDEGKILFYAGCEQSQKRFEEAWMAETHTVCPIKNIEFYGTSSNKPFCVFTDNLLKEMWTTSRWYNFVNEQGYEWYATMDKECFVN